MSDDLPSWSSVDAQAQALKLAATPSELHGALCGWLAGGGSDVPDWLAKVLADDQAPKPESGSALDAMRAASRAQFEDRDFGFALLLPDEDAPLAERSEALFEWCRGFLGGFGLAAGKDPPLSEEGREALDDLARLAAATPEPDGDEEDEEAYAEIEEFVRVAALLLHGDCVMGPRHRHRLN
ncbi:MAG TPA: UPF0149 family protein [Luteimonas sp.]|nr:UPF0149 family protein [Luteimonas sp.]